MLKRRIYNLYNVGIQRGDAMFGRLFSVIGVVFLVAILSGCHSAPPNLAAQAKEADSSEMQIPPPLLNLEVEEVFAPLNMCNEKLPLMPQKMREEVQRGISDRSFSTTGSVNEFEGRYISGWVMCLVALDFRELLVSGDFSLYKASFNSVPFITYGMLDDLRTFSKSPLLNPAQLKSLNSVVRSLAFDLVKDGRWWIQELLQKRFPHTVWEWTSEEKEEVARHLADKGWTTGGSVWFPLLMEWTKLNDMDYAEKVQASYQRISESAPESFRAPKSAPNRQSKVVFEFVGD